MAGYAVSSNRALAFKMILAYMIGLLLCIQGVVANVEKTIFLGPNTVNIPPQPPTLEDLRIDVLTPERWSLRMHIQAEFPTESHEKGKTTWLLLDNLAPGQRYEVRICWAATQPTDFHLETYELSTVWHTAELITSLSEYSHSRQVGDSGPDSQPRPGVYHPSPSLGHGEREASVLFLQISAAADYFTTNAALMRDVPPVYVDIILDPYVFNILPRSLATAAGYIVAVAIASWFIAARFVMPWIQGIVDAGRAVAAKKDQ